MAQINLTGRRIGKLFVVEFIPKYFPERGGWLCCCDCGVFKVLRPTVLLEGETFSCGCHKSKPGPRKAKKFGGIQAKEYKNWTSMRQRCMSPNQTGYERYGGKGIEVCDEWKNSFEKFMEDMGERPSSNHSLDRIDNTKGYFKENCRWATAKEQANNRTNNRKIEFDGEIKNLGEWATEFGISATALKRLVGRKLSSEEIREWKEKKSVDKETPID